MANIMDFSVGDIVRVGSSLHMVAGYDMGSLLIVWQLSLKRRGIRSYTLAAPEECTKINL
jgi:hypothetical protein